LLWCSFLYQPKYKTFRFSLLTYRHSSTVVLLFSSMRMVYFESIAYYKREANLSLLSYSNEVQDISVKKQKSTNSECLNLCYEDAI